MRFKKQTITIPDGLTEYLIPFVDNDLASLGSSKFEVVTVTYHVKSKMFTCSCSNKRMDFDEDSKKSCASCSHIDCTMLKYKFVEEQNNENSK